MSAPPIISVCRFGVVTMRWEHAPSPEVRRAAEADYKAESGRRGFIRYCHEWPTRRQRNGQERRLGAAYRTSRW